jgi:hypothetical protein
VITPFIGPVADSGVCNPMRGAFVEREFVPTYVPEGKRLFRARQLEVPGQERHLVQTGGDSSQQ